MNAHIALTSLFVSIGILLITSLYVGIVAWTLYYIRGQFEGQEKNRKLQAALTIFQDLQSEKVRSARRYIYESVPVSIEDVEESELKKHSIACEDAIQMFHRVGLSDKGRSN